MTGKMEMERYEQADEIAQPIAEKNTAKLPSAVTFYLDAKQRRDLLSVLKRYSSDRSQAILIALGLVETK